MSKQNAQTYMTQQRDLALVLAVDLGGTQIRTAVLRGDKLLSRVRLLTGQDTLPERILPRIFTAIQQASVTTGQ